MKLSNSQRQKLEKEGTIARGGATIYFSPQDREEVQAPHNDALVITAGIGGYDVRRILIDCGSAVDIITLTCLRKMDVGVELKAAQTRLIGFNNCSADPCGEIHLPVTLGGSLRSQTKTVRFLVIYEELSYNVILGRPSLNQFQAVTSTFHMKIKFSVKGEVGEVRGNRAQPENVTKLPSRRRSGKIRGPIRAPRKRME